MTRRAGTEPLEARGSSGAVVSASRAGQALLLTALLLALAPAATARPQASAGLSLEAYVADLGSAAITPVALPSGHVEAAISLGGKLPVAVAASPRGNDVYVVAVGSDEDGSPGSLLVLDTATGVLSKSIAVAQAAQAIALSPDGKSAYVLGGLDAATTPATASIPLVIVDAATDKVRATVKVGTSPEGMALSPNAKYLYVIDHSPSNAIVPTVVTPVDVATGKAGAAIHVAAMALAFSPDSSSAYALSSLYGLVPISTATGKLRPAVDLLPAIGLALAVTPNGDTAEVLGTPDPGLVVGSPEGDNWTLTPVDLKDGKRGTPIKLGVHPGAVTGQVLLAPNGQTAYALIDGTASAAGTVVPVDLGNGKAGAPVGVGRNAAAIELAPGGTSAYVLDDGSYSGSGSSANRAGALVPLSLGIDSAVAHAPIKVGLAPQAFTIADPSSRGASAGGGSAGASNLKATTAVKSALVAAFAPAHGVSRSEVGGTYPGSVYYAYDSLTKTYWAVAYFDPAKGDSAKVADTFQDAGSNGIFSRTSAGAWRFRGSGAPLLCPEEKLVPPNVLAVWNIPRTSPVC